jgi:branched-subunit amino acid ABC-type transport system permease component/ABC-type branched-subunit amino acid transport system ATPase component
MSTFWILVISGAVSGAIFSIMAVGIVLTFTTSGVFNFAHGAVAFAVAFIYFELRVGLGWPTPIAAVICLLVIAPLFGLALEQVMLRRLAGAPVYTRIVGTIGILVMAPALVIWIVVLIDLHGGTLPSPTSVFTAPGLGPVPAETFTLFHGVVVDSDQLITLAAAAIVGIALWLLLSRTRLGLEMRADVDRRQLAMLRGIDSTRVSRVAWILTMMLAGLGGILLAPLLGMDNTLYTFVVLGALAAVVVGRMRSLPIVFAGGILLGIIQNLVAGYGTDFLPSFLANLSGFRTAIPFILTFIALIVVGQSRKVRTAGTRSTEAAPPDLLAGMNPWRRRAPWIGFYVVLIVWLFGFAGDYWAGLAAQGIALGIVFLSIVLVTGMAGMVSLAQVTFVTAGSFTAGWLLQNHHWSIGVPFLINHGQVNFVVAAAAGTLVAMVIGFLIAVPVRRLGVLEFALATLSISFVADQVVFQVDSIRNQSVGYTLTAPSLGFLHFSSPQVMALLLLGVFGVVTAVVTCIRRSATGRAMFATRSSDVAARTSGLSPDRVRVGVFVIGAGIAGLGGVFYAVLASPFTNLSTPPLTGLVWLAAVVTFGVRRPGGALIAGLLAGAGYELTLWLTSWNSTLNAAVGSTWFLPILFGLGGIGLAQNPDGTLALLRTNRMHRAQKRSARSANVSTAVDEESASPLTSNNALLAMRGVVAGYGGLEVLHDVDLEIERGSMMALVGPNGGGKSTLCLLIAGIVEPTRGSIEFDGKSITTLSAHKRSRAGIMLAPENRGVFPGLSVEENLAVWLDKSERNQAYEQFPILGTRRRQPAGLLSGGEQQMLALVPMLVRPPKLLIADEPTLGLAPLAIEIVTGTLRQLRELGVSILVTLEKASEVLELADTVAILTLGSMTWVGAQSTFNQQLLIDAHLGQTFDASVASDTRERSVLGT